MNKKLSIKTVHHHGEFLYENGMRWIDIAKPTPVAMKKLQKEYGFHDLDIEDCLTPGHVAKVDSYDGYLFMVLLFPVFIPQTGEVISSEVNFFIKNDALITIHDKEIHTLDDFWRRCERHDDVRKKIFKKDTSVLLYHVLEQLLLYTFPMLEHVHEEIKKLEKRIFTGYEREVVRDLLNLKRNIINLRKTMQFHKGMIRRLMMKGENILPLSKHQVYYNNLIEHTKDIWDTLEIQKENIDALHATNESLISFRLNDIMKFLTITSVILFPVSLVAGIFGMNIENMPIVRNVHSFWIILGIMLMICGSMILFFRKKKWL